MIQAESYNFVKGEVDLGDGGTTVQQFNNKEYLYYQTVNFDGAGRISVNYATAIDGGALEFRLDAPDGELIAFVDLPNTGGWQNFVTTYGRIVGDVSGQHSLYVVARNMSKQRLRVISDEVAGNIDYFTLSPDSSLIQDSRRVIEENNFGFCYFGDLLTEGAVENTYEGALGVGYISPGDSQSFVAATWKVNAPETGVYRLRFRYANGGGSPLLGLLALNHIRTQTLHFSPTTAWSDWQYIDVKVPLYTGDNTIQLSPDVGGGLPNIDSLTIIGAYVATMECGVDDALPLRPYDYYGWISVSDVGPGWASMNGGTNGGGTYLFDSSTLNVETMDQLQSAVSGTEPRYVLIHGNHNGTLRIGSNKYIFAENGSSTLTGNIIISGSSNVILRNLKVRGNHCDSYDECKEGPAAVYVGDGATNIWLDHLDIADGQNGNLTVTDEADFVTLSWSKLHYTYDKEHIASNLTVSSNHETQSREKPRITYMNNWWGPETDQDLPRGKSGNIHIFNNYFNTGASQIHGVGYEIALIAENNFYEEPGREIFTDLGSSAGWLGIGNEGNAVGMNTSFGSVFPIPYPYTLIPASAVKSEVTSRRCGAGDNCNEDP